MLTPHGWLELRSAEDDADLHDVAFINRQCYPDEAWTTADAEEFAARHGNVAKVMALEHGPVIGSLLYRIRDDAVQIARIAVLPRYRRCRMAAYALRSLVGPGSEGQPELYEIRVREDSDTAIAFLRRCGFAADDVDRQHYRDGRDAYVFRLHKKAPHRPRLPVSVG